MIDVCVCVCNCSLYGAPRLLCCRSRCCFSLTLSEQHYHYCYYLQPEKSFPGTYKSFLFHICAMEFPILALISYWEFQFLYYLKFLNTCWESRFLITMRSHTHDCIQVYKRLYYFYLLLFQFRIALYNFIVPYRRLVYNISARVCRCVCAYVFVRGVCVRVCVCASNIIFMTFFGS